MSSNPNRPGGSNKRTGQETGLPDEDDLATMLYGTTNEGFEATPNDSAEVTAGMRRRFTMRRALANLYRFPEGYEIVLPITGSDRAVILLTPPDLVAVQRHDGTWFRRIRNVKDDGPAPYSPEWYEAYLRANNLPSYFLRRDHVEVLESNAEAQNLGIANLPDLPQPDQTFLYRRYPNQVEYLLPDEVVTASGEVVTASDEEDTTKATPVDLSPSQQERLGLRFPGTIANTTLFNSYRVYVLPSGHITLRYHGTGQPSNDVPISHEQLRTVNESAQTYLASYRIQGRRIGLTPGSTRERTEERANAVREGDLVDLNEQPNGLGSWHWLNRDIDPQIAMQYGLHTPTGVMRARENGVLTNAPYRHLPLTVWRPDLRFVNPDTQPQGQGRWEYTTTPSRDLAWINHGVPDNRHPTAAQIWDLRCRMRDEVERVDREEDTTAAIDLVWVPSVPIPAATVQPAAPSNDPDVIDKNSGLRHDPTNGGEHDQTGVKGKRILQSILINGKIVTVDRSRAHAGVIEEWKSWAVTGNGTWKQWRKYANIDWSKQKESVEKMNKWREQALKRTGFPRKRDDDREDYLDEERNWVFEFVRAASGGRPSNISMAELARRFNARFPRLVRSVIAVQSLYDRQRDDYNENNGQLRPPSRHGRRRDTNQGAEGNDDEDDDEDADNGPPDDGSDRGFEDEDVED